MGLAGAKLCAIACLAGCGSICAAAGIEDRGSIVAGGCDNSAAGVNTTSGPLWNGGSNEFYTKYMDAGEYTGYALLFANLTGTPLTDVTVSLSFSGAGASKMTVFDNSIHVGRVPAGATAGAVFLLGTDASAAGLDAVNLDFDVTSPADGYAAPVRITHAQLLQANDAVIREQRCSTFSTLAEFSSWYESPVGGHATSIWRWSGTAASPGTVGSETLLDGICGDATPNAAAMIGNSGTTAGNNFNGNSDSFLLQRFQPALLGNGPSGQPYRYAWKWHSFYHSSETPGASTGAWGAFYDDRWNQAVDPTGDQAAAFPIKTGYLSQTFFDNGSSWSWAPGSQFVVSFSNVTGFATPGTWFAYGHEHADITVFGGTSSATSRRDIALDNDNLVYDEFYAEAQAGASCGSEGQIGLLAFDQYRYVACPSGTAHVGVVDANATGPLVATLTSPGTGDSESVSLTGVAPYFSGTIAVSTQSGQGIGDGTLFVVSGGSITASYTDDAPAGTSAATAATIAEVPMESQDVAGSKTGTTALFSWTMAVGGTQSDVLRGLLSALPVGPGGSDEVCFGGVPGTSLSDADVPSPGTGYWYLVRGRTDCGAGTWGEARSSVTCP